MNPFFTPDQASPVEIEPDDDRKVDEHGSLLFMNNIGSTVTTVASPNRSPTTGVATVETADVAVALSTGLQCSRVAIKAPSTNGKTVYIGSSSVTADDGFPLDPDAPVLELHIDNVNKLYVTSSAVSQTVRWLSI